MAAMSAGDPTPAQLQIEEAYRRRARRLAERPAEAGPSATLAVLVFVLADERYGIELSKLAEVLPYRDCTPVPKALPALLGVINVRGEIRAVADLRRVLELSADDRAAGYILMLGRQGDAIGLSVDAIEGVRLIDPALIASIRDAAAPIPGSRFVAAVTADAVALIDTDEVLSALGLDRRAPRM